MTSRRTFLAGAAGTAAAAGMLGAIPAHAFPTPPLNRHRSLDDIEHVVVLMQENRSVDHYFGTMRGVRGFSDKTALRFANGGTVFAQPTSTRPEGFLLPWHADTATTDAQDLAGNDHSWGGVHRQWAGGANTGFVPGANPNSMACFTKADVPFQRALAAAFTFCDHYFCSIKGSTTPNRLFHWTGTIDPNGRAGGPGIGSPPNYVPVYRWTTYPERLQKAGISWQVYANDEVGSGSGEDGWVGDYSDNPLWSFQAYHDALASPDPTVRQLAQRGSVRTSWMPNSGLGHDVRHVLAQFLDDVGRGHLPAVSWVVAPYAYSEHPAARPVDGAAFTQTVLAAIWAQPQLWAKTVVFINFDEHDGFFDHVVPPTAPPGTPDEYVQGLPVGLGPRVPMTVVSPWSRGGWINSQVFDHTSVLRFLELWTAVREPNISTWRRAICGDLTSCFDFGTPVTRIPLLPDTAALRSEADRRDATLPSPAPPAAGEQAAPVQEPGTAPARALPYQAWANAWHSAGAVHLRLGNVGLAALQVQVYDLTSASPARRVDLAPAGSRALAIAAVAGYQVAVHGPNGFLREVHGDATSEGIEASLRVTGTFDAPGLRLTLTNATSRTVTFVVQGAGSTKRIPVTNAARALDLDPVRTSQGWYDLRVRLDGVAGYLRRFAGHLENGRPSITG